MNRVSSTDYISYTCDNVERILQDVVDEAEKARKRIVKEVTEPFREAINEVIIDLSDIIKDLETEVATLKYQVYELEKDNHTLIADNKELEAKAERLQRYLDALPNFTLEGWIE